LFEVCCNERQSFFIRACCIGDFARFSAALLFGKLVVSGHIALAIGAFSMIKIAVVSYNNEAPATPIVAIFGPERETIGRSEGNFLVLPDPKHYVSRAQATVWSNGLRHHLINLSQANPILINGAEIEPEREYDIHPGDQIQIGLYLLRAEAYVGQGAANMSTLPPQAAQVEVPVATPAAPIHAPVQETHPAAANLQTLPPRPAAAAATAATAPVEPHEVHPNTQELLQAFLNGAGIPNLSVSSGLNAELMETLGKLVATSIQGTMELIAQRALVKREVKAEVTMVVLRKNNPLKFFPDSQTVLTQMLRKKMPGFMEPWEAMEDSFLDLRAHQFGVVAGMRAAMDALLKRLHPSNFEKKLKAPTLMDSINPTRRKGEMWDSFAEQFGGISL
jgi:FHA domain-containing protein